MIKLSGPFGVAAGFILISAMLHIFAFVVGGFSSEALSLIPIGILYIALVAGLIRGWRWLAWVSFFVIAIAGIFALSQVWTPSPVPAWWTVLIVIVDGLSVVAIFGSLWRSPPAITQST